MTGYQDFKNNTYYLIFLSKNNYIAHYEVVLLFGKVQHRQSFIHIFIIHILGCQVGGKDVLVGVVILFQFVFPEGVYSADILTQYWLLVYRQSSLSSPLAWFGCTD